MSLELQDAAGKMQVKLDYHVENMAQVYDDVAEIYWKYVGSQWAEPSRNVTCTVSLPIPEGVAMQPGENVRAWGHGDLDGTISFSENGSVVFFSPDVSAGEFAEARIAFPSEWLTASPTEATYAGNRLDAILVEEQQWADEANRSRTLGLVVFLTSAPFCIAAIAWALVMFFHHGKEYKAEFTDEYWRGIPDPNASPASIAKLWHKDADTPDELTATIPDLAQRGAFRLEPGQYADERGRMLSDYCIIRVPEVFTKCKALENWLVNFTAIDERPPTNVKMWSVFMVYAFMFGVADKVAKELRIAVPQVFDDTFYAGGGGGGGGAR